MIVRDVAAAAATQHDLIVIGGGIYGACIAFEAVKRGLRPLLLEKNDFGGATSWNSLRIVHGGLRYLQTADAQRHIESVRERRWFMTTFPDLVKPLPCLMPLYKSSGMLKRPSIMRAALCLNDLLSCTRNRGVRADRRLEGGRLLTPDQVLARVPGVRRDGLCAAALWHDACMLSPQRIIMQLLHAACAGGAMSLNYVEASAALTHRGAVVGVTARDRLTRETVEFRAPIVVNATGPWCAALAARLDESIRKNSERFVSPSLAYNLLLKRPPLYEGALAASAPGSRVYFLNPVRGGVMAGTEHAPVANGSGLDGPTPEQIQWTLRELNRAVLGWELSERDVLRVYSGVLPARRPQSEELARRPSIVDHGRHGGARGLYSISGVKFTTARLVAERVVARVSSGAARWSGGFQSGRKLLDRAPDYGIDLIAPDQLFNGDDDEVCSALRRVLSDEAVIETDDLLHRRTSWLDDPQIEGAVRKRVYRLLQAKRNSSPPVNSAPRPMEVQRSRAMLP